MGEIRLNKYSREKVILDVGIGDVEVTEPRGLRIVGSDEGELIVSEVNNGGFRVVYRGRESDFDAGEVQFKNRVISRPGEAGYDHGD